MSILTIYIYIYTQEPSQEDTVPSDIYDYLDKIDKDEDTEDQVIIT